MLEETYSMEGVLERRNLWHHVRGVLNNLTDEEINVLRMYYFEHKTYKEIGEALGGLSRNRAWEIAHKALRKIRSRLTRKGIAENEDFYRAKAQIQEAPDDKAQAKEQKSRDLYERLRWRGGRKKPTESKEQWEVILHHTYRCGTKKKIVLTWDQHKGFCAADVS